jgi:GNAT superfamily N-acetyltransferase
MRYHLRKLRALYDEGGARHVARKLVTHLGSRLYRDEDHVVILKHLEDPRPRIAHSDIEVRAAGAGDIAALQEFYRRHQPARIRRYARSYLRRGYPAYLAFRDGRLIGFFWWVDAKIDARHPDVLLHELELRPRDTYAFAYFVAPEHRGSNTATAFTAAILDALRDAGYERVWGWTRADNRPARWHFRVAGFQEERRVRVRTVLSLLALSGRRVVLLGWGAVHPLPTWGWVRPAQRAGGPGAGDASPRREPGASC